VEDSCAKCTSRFQFGVVVLLDVLFIVIIFLGLWIGFGFLGDVGFNKIFLSSCHNSTTITGKKVSPPDWCNFFKFTQDPIWQGRVWFYGFVLFFFVLGIIGCFFFLCCRDKNPSSKLKEDRQYYYDRSSCYWWWCGPTYYGGYYYSSPYGYYNSTDLLCCWCCLTNSSPHHHSTVNNWDCNCNANDCNASGGNCNGNNDLGSAFIIVILIVVIIGIICGIIFTAFVSLMIINKIIKRHMHILQRQALTKVERIRDRDQKAPVEITTVTDIENQGLLQTSINSNY